MFNNDSMSTGAVKELSKATPLPKILCIDDDPEITRTIELRLSKYAVTVLSAYHGMHGFWLAMTERPDLIVTDINMPQGKGDYIVECLRRNSETSSIPVVVLSGQRERQLKQRMRNLGVANYLTKPCDSAELLAAIGDVVPLEPTVHATADQVK